MDKSIQWARDAARDVIEESPFLRSWLFERAPASSQPLVESYMSKASEADLMIWLVESETTPPVRAELYAALGTGAKILAFRIDTERIGKSTTSVLEHVDVKYDHVADADDLKSKCRAALADEIVRAWRSAGRSPRRVLLQTLAARSRSRCIDRWMALGISSEVAGQFADDRSVGMLHTSPFALGRFAILRGEIGSGKSLAADRIFEGVLQQAASDSGEQIPIFLEAKNITGSLQGSLVESGYESMPSGRFLLVLDGLDEAPIDRRLDLARAARQVSIACPEARVLVTSRPFYDLAGPFSGSLVDMSPMSHDESLPLISRVAGHDLVRGAFWDLPDSFNEAIRRPLFALLVGLMHRTESFSPVPFGRLLSDLVAASLGRANASQESADPLLRCLARVATDRGGGVIPLAELATYAEIAPLLRSRLIAERRGQVMFSLAIISEWFAARALEQGTPSALDLVDDAKRLENWTVPITMCLADTSHGTFARLMRPLADRHPATAAQVLDGSVPDWPTDTTVRLPSWQDCGRLWVVAIRAWLTGLGPLERLLASIDQAVNPPSLGVLRLDTSTLAIAWASVDQNGPLVELPVGFQSDATWPRWEIRSNQGGPGWEWRWSHELVCRALDKLLNRRMLPIPHSLRGESHWRTALSLVGRHGAFETVPIAVSLLQEMVEECIPPDVNIRIGSPPGVRPHSQALSELLLDIKGSHVSPPWPGPDKPIGPYVWSGYSWESILIRTERVYVAALNAYREMVERWFPKFRKEFWLYSRHPFRMVGALRRWPLDSTQVGLTLGYFLEADLEGSGWTVDLKLADENSWREFNGRANDKLDRGETDRISHSVPDVFGLSAAEDLAYSWLRDDLNGVHWKLR